MRSLLALVLFAALLGCSGGSYDLFVDVRTDLAPELEFDEVVVELLDERGRAGEVVRRSARAVLSSHDYATGHRVAEWSEIAPGTYFPRVEVRRDGAAIADLLAEVTLDADRAITIVVSRACVGVACPMVGGDPSATSCLAGRCAEPECLVVDGPGCPSRDGGPRPLDGGPAVDSGGATDARIDAPARDGSLPDGGGVDPDLVAWYSFDTFRADGVDDDGPNGLDGNCTPGMCGTSTPGVAGLAHQLDGFDDVVVVPYADVLDTPHLSVAAWIRSDAHETGIRMVASIAFGLDYGNSWSLYFYDWEMDGTVDANFAVSDRVASDRATAVAPAPATWAFLVGTYDGSRIRLYIDGVIAGQFMRPGIAVFDAHDLIIGGDSNIDGPLGSFWNGAIDELRIYRRALTDDEITAIYERERP